MPEGLHSIRELFPAANGIMYRDLYQAVRKTAVRRITIQHATHHGTLAVIDLGEGTTSATLPMEEAGLSPNSGCTVWEPRLPLVDIQPCETLDNRGSL